MFYKRLRNWQRETQDTFESNTVEIACVIKAWLRPENMRRIKFQFLGRDPSPFLMVIAFMRTPISFTQYKHLSNTQWQGFRTLTIWRSMHWISLNFECSKMFENVPKLLLFSYCAVLPGNIRITNANHRQNTQILNLFISRFRNWRLKNQHH